MGDEYVKAFEKHMSDLPKSGEYLPKFFTASDFESVRSNARPHSYYYPPDGLAQDFADTANRLLSERGVRVYGENMQSTGEMIWCRENATHVPYATHTALLVAVEPIVRESAEDVLRELVALERDTPRFVGEKGRDIFAELPALIDRARRVLEGGAK